MRFFRLFILFTYAACGYVVTAAEVPQDTTHGIDTLTVLETGEQQQPPTTTAAPDYVTGSNTIASTTATAMTGSNVSATNTNTSTPTTVAPAPLNTSSVTGSESNPSRCQVNILNQRRWNRYNRHKRSSAPSQTHAGVDCCRSFSYTPWCNLRVHWDPEFMVRWRYCSSGIKIMRLTKTFRIQTFLSGAFLTGLVVTVSFPSSLPDNSSSNPLIIAPVQVLIIYLMNPPVSAAVQGGYLVAIVTTGLVFGILFVVFKNWTEGLGCLLGGFSLSMWILTLVPGGLFTGPGPKAGLIGGLCVVSYALSLSKYTRPYGLILSTAFSGATALTLGIDCYTRAGLKEFWLYIWGKKEQVLELKNIYIKGRSNC